MRLASFSVGPLGVRSRPKPAQRECPLRAISGHIAKLFLVEADTTNLVTNLRIEGGLFERLVCARARPPVGGLLYRSLSGTRDASALLSASLPWAQLNGWQFCFRHYAPWSPLPWCTPTTGVRAQ